jgi:diadenylate cyclase
MILNDISTTVRGLIDISIIWILVYSILKSLKGNIKMVFLLKGIIIVGILKVLSDLFDLRTTKLILEYIFNWGVLAIIIIFQPEIRNALEQLGKKQIITTHKSLTMDEREKIVYELMNAIDYMRKARIGGLIVIEREISLNDYIEKSKTLMADISSDLLVSIFFPRNPLHDGGVIIQGDKISCAGAVFPTTVDMKFSKRLGTRHRAAIGISEESDAIAIIVSEETGRISVAVEGKLNYNLSIDEVKSIILEELMPKSETFVVEKEEEEDDVDEIN